MGGGNKGQTDRVVGFPWESPWDCGTRDNKIKDRVVGFPWVPMFPTGGGGGGGRQEQLRYFEHGNV